MINILYMGRKRVAADCLEWLAGHSAVKVVGVLTDNHLAVSATSAVARAHNLHILDYAEALARLRDGSLVYDLGLSVLYWRKLKGEFLTVPKFGSINFHPAPLPEYKGTAGYNLAILEALAQWGITAHYMDSAIDTGGIIEVDSFPIDPDHETVGSLERTCAAKMAVLFKKIVTEVLTRRAVLPTTPNLGGQYISRQQMEEMKEIKPGDDISRKVRAFWYPPYDGAWINMGGEKYTLASRQILQHLADPAASTLFTKSANAAEDGRSGSDADR